MKKILTLAAVMSACSFGAAGQMLGHSGSINEVSYNFMFHGFRLATVNANPTCLTMTQTGYTTGDGSGETTMIRCASAFNDYRPDLGTRDLEFTEANEIKLLGENLCLQGEPVEFSRTVAMPCNGENNQKWRIMRAMGSRNGQYHYNISDPSGKFCLYSWDADRTGSDPDYNPGPMMLKCDEKVAKEMHKDHQLLKIFNKQYKTGIELYSEPNYQGEMFELNTDQPNLNDFRVGSYKLPMGYAIRFFADENMRGGFYTRNASKMDDMGIASLALKSVAIVARPLSPPVDPMPEPEPEPEAPEVSQVVLYANEGFEGHNFSFNQNIPQLRDPFRNIKSFSIPDDWEVRFFEGANYTGGFYTRTSSKADNELSNITMNSFAIVRRGDQPGEPYVAAENNTAVVLTTANGSTLRLDADVPSITSFRSLSIPEGWTVRFFQEENYGGGFYTIEHHRVAQVASYVTGGKVKSMKIISR